MSALIDQFLSENAPPEPAQAWNPPDANLDLTTGVHPTPLSIELPPNPSILAQFNQENEGEARNVLKERARSLWTARHNGQIDLTPKQDHELYQLLHSDTTPVSNLAEAGKGALDWIKNFSPSGIVEGIGHGIAVGGRGIGRIINPIKSEKETLQTGADVLTGGYNSLSSLVPLGMDVLSGADNLANYLMGSPEYNDQRERNIVMAEHVHGATARTQQGLSSAIEQHAGVTPDPESDVGKTVGLGVQAALSIGGASEAGGLIAKSVEAGVEKLPQVAGRVAGGTIKGTRAVAPAVAAYELAKFGHPVAAAIELVAGYGGEYVPYVARFQRAIIDPAFDKASEIAKVFSEAKDGVPVMKSWQNSIQDKLRQLSEQEADKRSGAVGTLKVDKLDSTGKPLYSLEELRGVDKEIRAIRDQADTLSRRSEMLNQYIDLNKMVSDGAKLGLNIAGQTGVGGAIMGGIGGVSAPTPEDIRASTQHGIETGVELTAPFAPMGAVRAMKAERFNQANKALSAMGQEAIKDHPDYELHQQTVSQLPPQIQNRIDVQNGMGVPIGAKTIVLPPEEILARSQSGGDNVVFGKSQQGEAPNGFFSKDDSTLYLNADKLSSGVWGHEFTHGTEIALGASAIKAIPEIEARINDPNTNPTYQEFAQKYVEGMRKTISNFPELSNGQIRSEALAEVGRMVLHDTPPEFFFGGESGGDVLKRLVYENFVPSSVKNKLQTDQVLGAPYTRQDLQDVKQTMFQVGEAAKQGLVANSSNRPDLQGVSGQRTVEQNAPSDLTGSPRGLSEPALDSIYVLESMGETKKSATEKVQAAIQDLEATGQPYTPEDIVKKSLQRTVPKEENLSQAEVQVQPSLASAIVAPEDIHRAIEQGTIKGPEDMPDNVRFMPSSDPRAVRSAAVQDADGKIYKGSYHGTAIDAAHRAKAKGFEVNDESWDVPYKVGFVSNAGEFLSREQALERGRQYNQLPADEIGYPGNPEGIIHTADFKNNQSFMPATEPPAQFKDLSDKEGLKYNGVMQATNPEDSLHLFTDPKTHSTISVKAGGDLADKLRASREKFQGGEDRISHMPATPGFKAWSKDSQVIDDARVGKHQFETGKPIVALVYHGTTSESFNVFDKSKLGEATDAPSAREGFFFSASPETANAYLAHSDFNQSIEHYTESAKSAEERGMAELAEKYRSFAESSSRKQAEYQGPRGHIKELYVKLQNPFVKDFEGQSFRDESYYDVMIKAKEDGHDGVIFTNTRDGGETDNIFATFDNKNIKLPNAKAFDPTTDNIYFMPAGDHPEAIDKPAVRLPDGKVYTGTLHMGAFGEAVTHYSAEQLGKWIKEHGDNYAESGFTTKDGKFLNVADALEHAKKIKQVTQEGLEKAKDAWGKFGIDNKVKGLETLDFETARQFMPSPEPKAIDRAAVRRIEDGKVFPSESKGSTHWMLPSQHPELKDYFSIDGYKKYEDGFVDNQGNFHDRESALKTMQDLGQLPKNFKSEYKDELNVTGLQQAKFMPASNPMVNIGLRIDKEGITLEPKDAIEALKEQGINVIKSSVHQSGTEPTLVATLDKHATPAQLHSVSESLDQDAVAYHLGGGIGELYGPKAENWKPFKPEYFLGHNGKPIELPQFMPSTYKDVQKYMTEDEKSTVGVAHVGKIVSKFNSIAHTVDEGAHMALAGQAKKDWYKDSANTISDTFGPDAPRFTALLASLSPQVSLETNLRNALHVWAEWNDAGRPKDANELGDIVARNITVGGKDKSALGAWVGNAVKSLTAEDASPESLKLSGPKVDSFYRNLLGDVNEITNDTWMAKYAGWEGFKNRTQDNRRIKGFDYLALNAHIRQVAGHLTELTGDKWSPAEIQATIWSFGKTLESIANKKGLTITELLLQKKDILDEIKKTPSFDTIFEHDRNQPALNRIRFPEVAPEEFAGTAPEDFSGLARTPRQANQPF